MKIKEITEEEFDELYNRLLNKALAKCNAAGREGDEAYWLSTLFRPCSGKINFKYVTWREKPLSCFHYTSIPCDTYRWEKLPMAICLIKTVDGRHFTCRHKVGNCPHKRKN